MEWAPEMTEATGKLDVVLSSCSAADGGAPEERAQVAWLLGDSTSVVPVAVGAEAGSAEAQEAADFADKRKQHYKMDFAAMKAAAMALEDEDEDEDDDDDAEATQAERKESSPTSHASASDFGGGHWAIGPEALHGGPKLGEGFAQSTSGAVEARADASLSMPGAVSVPAAASSAPPAKADLGPCLPPGPAVLGLGEGSALQAHGAKQKEKKVLTWDEEAIAEHDLERGTRQKIEEPNTPWMGSPSCSAPGSAIHSSTPCVLHEESGAQPVSATSVPLVEQDVQDRLQTWFHNERHRASIQEQWGDLIEKCPAAAAAAAASQSSADQLSLEEKKARDFAEKRKNHYKVDLKSMRAQEESEEDESEEDE